MKIVAARLFLVRPLLGSARSIGFGPAAIPDGIRRQITILLVPFRRSSQPLIEANAGPVADFPLRLVDIESAILPEPVYPAREDRRRDSEGLADRFADMAPGDRSEESSVGKEWCST